MSSERIEALRQALRHTPENYPLRVILAESLQTEGRTEESLAEYDIVLQAGQLDSVLLVPVGDLALQTNNVDLASRCLDAALKEGVVTGVSRLRAKLDEQLAEEGYIRVVVPTAKTEDDLHEGSPSEDKEVVTFEEVGGLEEVKKAIHKLIILPLLRPDLYRRYRRKPGGGILLFGPPGCGKTLLARATAGECELPFINVRIEQILDPYLGRSERNLHMAFEQARSLAPCVLFIDELDALAYARRKRISSVGRSLVDQVLQELDAIGADNQELLVLAATNEPWDIDDALLRPGRFDRRIFVPPPDKNSRERILQIMLTDLPLAVVNLKKIAGETPLYSGADLRALVNFAVDKVIEEALETAGEPPITMKHLQSAIQMLHPTTIDWLERAQNYIEFANQDKRYSEVASYLKTREVRRWRSGK
jgi:transitional endoplasmic reticulum ATPase